MSAIDKKGGVPNDPLKTPNVTLRILTDLLKILHISNTEAPTLDVRLTFSSRREGPTISSL